MKTNRQEKQEFYSDSETVKKYEELRFSNAGGQFVHQSEVSLFSKFLNICSLRESILDIPVAREECFQLLRRLALNRFMRQITLMRCSQFVTRTLCS